MSEKPRTMKIVTGAVTLRSEPKTVSEKNALKEFHIDNIPGRPLQYIRNDYEDQGDVVCDRMTGLVWQKSGHESVWEDGPLGIDMTAEAYVQHLNTQRFAGYNDWRLPTIPELMSLLEPDKKLQDDPDIMKHHFYTYIDPIFNTPQGWCPSADRLNAHGGIWRVSFWNGTVDWYYPEDTERYRCVRP